MPITTYTILWTILALIGVWGLFLEKKTKTFWSFLTDKTHLILFIFAALFGMRQNYAEATIILSLSFVTLWYNYSTYKCKYLCKRKK